MRSFHEGELEVQRRAGVAAEAARTAGVLRDHIPAAAMDFVRHRQFAVLAGVEPAGTVRASLLFGEPGFLHAPDDRTLRLRASCWTEDQQRGDASPGAPAGFLVIDLATRRRAKFKGTVATRNDEFFQFRIDRCYSLCPKYIQARDSAPLKRNETPETAEGSSLSEPQRRRISRADTFFIATYHPDTGADASHRGGLPGFVRVLEPDLIAIPDYAGNNMFNTLGNLTANPNVGLVFPDFDSGSLLQLSGTGRILYDGDLVAQLPGAQRAVCVRIQSTREISHAMPLAWSLPEYSPFNPSK